MRQKRTFAWARYPNCQKGLAAETIEAFRAGKTAATRIALTWDALEETVCATGGLGVDARMLHTSASAKRASTSRLNPTILPFGGAVSTAHNA